jgi:hypothetical protein
VERVRQAFVRSPKQVQCYISCKQMAIKFFGSPEA